MADRTGRPWYSILYIIFGAQGSFFLWIGTLIGIYFTYQDAVLWAFNPEPRDVEVGAAARLEAGPRRWVRVHGIQVDLGENREDERDVAILIDPQDPAALRWRDLFQKMKQFRVEDRLTESLLALFAELDLVVDDDGRSLKPIRPGSAYCPRNALALVRARREAETPPLHLGQAAGGGEGPSGGGADAEAAAGPRSPADTGAPPAAAPDAFDRRLQEFLEKQARRIQLVRDSVRPDVECRGLLEPLTEGLKLRLDPYGADAGAHVLRVDARPSRTAASLFATFALITLLLLVGLKGLRSTAAPPAATAMTPATAIVPAPAAPSAPAPAPPAMASPAAAPAAAPPAPGTGP